MFIWMTLALLNIQVHSWWRHSAGNAKLWNNLHYILAQNPGHQHQQMLALILSFSKQNMPLMIAFLVLTSYMYVFQPWALVLIRLHGFIPTYSSSTILWSKTEMVKWLASNCLIYSSRAKASRTKVFWNNCTPLSSTGNLSNVVPIFQNSWGGKAIICELALLSGFNWILYGIWLLGRRMAEWESIRYCCFIVAIYRTIQAQVTMPQHSAWLCAFDYWGYIILPPVTFYVQLPLSCVQELESILEPVTDHNAD